MRVEYEKTIMEKIDDVIIDAKRNNKVINSIVLDPNETQEIRKYVENNIDKFYNTCIGISYTGVRFPLLYKGVKLKIEGQRT
jgi:hypothetical protein